MTDPRAATGPDDEQEVSLASGWERLKARWWLPVAGLAVGAVIGLALAVAGGNVWRAQAIVYLGQPFAPLGGGQIQSLATNPRTVNEVVHSESALKRASAISGIPTSRLRSSVSISEVTSAGQLRGINPLAEIAVKGPGRHKVELAADALATRVVNRVSVYVTQKVRLLQSEAAAAQAQLDAANRRIAQAEAQQTALVSNGSLTTVEKLLLSANLNSVIATTDAKRTSLQEDLTNAQQLLNLAKTVEQSHIVEPASAGKTTARSSRTSLVVGAFIGLIIGIVAALLAEPFAARRRRTAADES
ncbi:MAG TPA: hypothetical protein VFK76_01210 [Gaiellaceae bacterium]|nr:hypothetical protein [Gaiellaceae bacterium]